MFPAVSIQDQTRAALPDTSERDLPFGALPNRSTILLLAGCAGLLIYFLGFFGAFGQGPISTAQWAWEAWNPENNQEHSRFVLPIAVALAIYHRKKLLAAVKKPSAVGMVYVIAGIITFVLGVRALQPRIAICALPLLIYGGARFLWGKEVGRVLIFPCLFLLFMIPIGGIVQGTVSLQLLVSWAVQGLSALIGVKIGTTLRALDDSFNFEIAEGCSGIRSLMAMTMLAALYVHFTQDKTWKQWTIFFGSIVFALIGNIGRIFTVILFARFIDPKIAGGIYHDYSGFIFFPVAVGAMVGFSSLLNLDWAKWIQDKTLPPPSAGPKAELTKPNPSISYDY
jgi:exosortase